MDQQITLTVFISVSTLVLIVYLIIEGRRSRVAKRLAELSSTGGPDAAGSASPDAQSGSFSKDSIRIQKDARKELKNRLLQAGIYKPGAAAAFAATRIIVGVTPLALCWLAANAEMMTKTQAILFGSFIGLFGTLAPSLWLDYLKRSRQSRIRRALPDVLDIVAVCLEGGLGMAAALSRVGRELADVHPMLALELSIVEREIQMGRTVGDAMRQFAERFDLEELRSLASVISQTERYGASVARALLVYGDTMRQRRGQKAEEMAQKATVKILFPTLLCIFPGIIIVLLGPAAIQIYQTFVLHGLQR